MLSSIIKRDESIAHIREYRFELSQLHERLAQAQAGTEPDELEAYCDALTSRLHRAIDTYLDSLPVLSFSRCPLTGKVVKMPMDTAGFAGPWWDYEQPLRLLWDGPETFCGYTGGAALEKLEEEIEHFCKPGTTHPFVVLEVLNIPGTKAVLSSVEVCGTQTYVLSHFAAHRPPEIPCINDLGSQYSTLVIDERPVKREGVMLEELSLDFDLERWIRIGKLLWIAPGDKSSLLRSDVALCPYLNLPGERAIVRVDRGNLSCTPIIH